MKHAIVKIGDYNIPLIGVPEEAVLGECDLCHDFFHIQKLELNENGRQFLCEKCKTVRIINSKESKI